MRYVEELGKAHYRSQWCANLIAHVAQEHILDVLLVLSIDTFFLELSFRLFDFADVSAESEVLRHLS